MNNQLVVHFVKAGHGTDLDTIGELAPHTFAGNDMRHKQFLFDSSVKAL
jgi:hypothetical protein